MDISKCIDRFLEPQRTSYTLASSDYGWLKHGSFEPRPNYFAVLLWNTLMGTTVYDSKIPVSEDAHVYCHSRKDGKDGCVYLGINNS